MLMIEVVANTMLLLVLLSVAIIGGTRFVQWLNEFATRSVVRIESRNMDGDLRRILED